MPLPGASIIVKGTNKGVTTDFDGNFVMSILKETTTIVVSFMGYATQEIAVDVNQTILNIQLVATASSLDEVIVSLRFQTREFLFLPQRSLIAPVCQKINC